MNNFIYTEKPSVGIVQIPIALLAHHPDNPRKDLGDLTELAASIKAKGVMQNLTVVPYRDAGGTGCYHVVIGNRRMEAAKKAGLPTLPCVIAHMTKAEQVQTMLLENMQRENLTPYEQAQGFRLMMDFGDSVGQISEKTGFSETTVRRRLKMAELDAETLHRVSERQLSLTDFDRLAEIEDVNVRNKVLEHIGTNNFDWHVAKAKEQQNERRVQETWRTALNAAGFTEIAAWSGGFVGMEGNLGTQVRMGTKKPEDLKPESYEADVRYYFFDYNWLYFRREKPAEVEQDEQDDEAERLREASYKALEQANDRTYALRLAYVKGMSESEAKKHAEAAIAAMAENDTYRCYWNDLDELFDCEGDALRQAIASYPYRTLLYMGFIASCGLHGNLQTYTWRAQYVPPIAGLTRLCHFLSAIGYTPSDEEVTLLDGTSELYLKEDAQ
jgi:ParB family chromosome partitioning protein